MSTEVAPTATTPLHSQNTETSKEGTRRSGKKKKKTSHSDGGYSSTTERRNDRFLEHEEAIIKDHSYTNQCYLTTSILLFFLMIGLIGINIYLFIPDEDSKQVPDNVPYALQTTRKGLAIASENLDCSLLAKRLHGSIQYLDSRPVLYMMALLMCLHITEPHSVASDSAISMMFHVKNGKDTFMTNLAYSSSQKREGDFDLKKCAFGNVDNIPCIVESMPNIMNGHVHLDEEITESSFNSQLFESGEGNYEDFYQELFLLFFNSDDGGDNEYKEATMTLYYKTSIPSSMRAANSLKAYAFPVSPLFAKLSQNRTLPPHIKKITGTSSVSKWMRMKMTEGVTRELMEKFLRDKKPSDVTQAGTLSFSLYGNYSKEEYNRALYVSIPRGPTLSVISVFIVKVVHDSMLTMKFEGKTIKEQEDAKESTMYTLIALSHRLAIDLLPESKEWTGFGSKKSLMSRADEFVEIARRTPIKDVAKVFQKYSRTKKVRRIYWDRVSSFLIFRSSHYGKKRGEHARFTNGDDVSQPFMSSAGIFISQKEFLDATDEKVIYAATSSGSVRTVDAVVIPVLRMLLFNEEPGKAVTAPAVYFDPRRRKFFCEDESAVSHPSFADHSKRIQEAVIANGVRCIHPNAKNFASIDRSGIVMHRKAGEVEDIVAATDPRQMDKNNYPVGY